MHRSRLAFILAGSAALVAAVRAQTPSADEDVARRQLESGRSFARQGNYTEAMKDFRAVAEAHGSSSVADNALLEMARYYLDVAGNTKDATTAVDTILKKYPTADAAPDAYVLMGRLALARGHQPAELETALANFDRVTRLFPDSAAVPRSLVLAAEAFWYQGHIDEARTNLARVEAEYPTSDAASDAYLAAGRVLLSQGEPVDAMEELQQVRNRWPNSRNAADALSQLTVLHRLYVRAKTGAAFAATIEAPGPARLPNVFGLAFGPRGAIYWAGENGVGVAATPPVPSPLPSVPKPRGLAREAGGTGFLVIDTGKLQPLTGPAIPVTVQRANGFKEPLVKIEAAAELSNGDWLVADEDEKSIQRISRTGDYVGIFAPVRVSRIAISPMDEVAGIDRDQKSVALFDATGKLTGRIPTKTAAYDVENPVDISYDTLGHLYVLGRDGLAVFGPYVKPASAAMSLAGAGSGRGATYALLTFYAEPEKNAGAFRRATAFAIDPSGAVWLYDDRAERIRVYR
jgi:TolA-binding protein